MPGLRTQNLMESLRSNQELKAVLDQNASDFIAKPLCETLAALLKEKDLSRSEAIRGSMLNTIYGQQIFAGTKTPSRDKLLAIAFGMNLNFEETDTLLKQQGYARLYPRKERDAVIIYGLLHKLSLLDTNTLLYENDMETLL